MSKVLDKIEKEFQSTTWLILNRKLTNILDYEKWLTKNVVYIKEGKSQISKDKIYYTIIDDFYWDSRNAFKNTLEPNEKWLISEKDLDEVVAKRSINDNELENLRLENAYKILKDITYLTIEMVVGPNQNIEKCPNYAKSVNCYYGQYFHYSKNCAYCDDPHKSENVFGCWCLLDSKFCIKCHASTKLIRCLEVTTSHNCRDS